MSLLLVVFAWRTVRRLGVPAIVIALAVLLLHSASFARHERRQAVGAVERVVQPLQHDLNHALGKAFRR
jgi:hypothetical protein